jgi:hypothetical protein
VLFELAEGRLKPGGTASLAAPAGFAFPPPGPNLAFTTDGGRLLLGAPNRGCRRLAAGGIACGTAELLERRGMGWERRAAFPPPAEEDGTVRFGQSVALSPDGSLALVGGTGEVGRSGALWQFALDGAEPRLIQMLAPERRDGWFGNDVALSGDGRRLAVGGEQAVWLYEREGEGFVLRKRLTAPDLEAGHFGETVALSRDGRMLLVGAPRTACDAGERCGIAYLFEEDGYWRLARTIRPSVSQADADFGHHIALDPDGRHLAVQGTALHVFSLTER